jgi:hypothetical protein
MKYHLPLVWQTTKHHAFHQEVCVHIFPCWLSRDSCQQMVALVSPEIFLEML